LPGRGVSRAQLAAEVLGDSHGLDNGRPVTTIVLRACAAETSIDISDAAELQDAEESIRERWARLGITVNELAHPGLFLNLPGLDGLSPGEPAHLSLRRLLRRPPTWQVADRLGAACSPLVCTDGMPAAAQQTLLVQLLAAGARLRYHGDFDWAGLVIGNFVTREFNAEPWRFGTADYRSATAEHGMPLRKNHGVMARWDDRLAGAMSERGVVVHEEAVVETLLTDLAARPPEPEKR
jgi:uncharacterized protein (TIGR02679 family)